MALIISFDIKKLVSTQGVRITTEKVMFFWPNHLFNTFFLLFSFSIWEAFSLLTFLSPHSQHKHLQHVETTKVSLLLNFSYLFPSNFSFFFLFCELNKEEEGMKNFAYKYLRSISLKWVCLKSFFKSRINLNPSLIPD